MLKARKSFGNSKIIRTFASSKQKKDKKSYINKNAPWCNGNTTGFGPVIASSNLTGASNI